MSEKTIKPTIFIIFGATGDLAKKKLFPALLDLHVNDVVNEKFKVIAFSRREWSDDDFRKFAQENILAKGHQHSQEQVDDFLQHIVYVRGEFDENEAYTRLTQRVEEQATALGECVDKLFYLATPPRFYETIAMQVADSGVAASCSDEKGWSRILLEKPFGRDPESAEQLEMQLMKLFKPEQLFLIDHYLAKETIQNILLFRFSNALFEPVWNSKNIDRVEIKLHEELGLEGRVTYYDGIGALRDVGQSHLLQMLALVAMEHPGELTTEAVRKARERVLEDVQLLEKEPLMRAQYKSYTSEEGIDPQSQTETFFRIAARVKNRRWKDTTFVLQSGKKLHERRATISVYFREAEDPLCEGAQECHMQNILRFTIQPDEGVKLTFWSRKPGFSAEMEEQTMSYMYEHKNGQIKPNAYEYVLYRAMQGDQMLFRTPREEKYSWKFVQDVLQKWEDIPLKQYPDGSDPENIINNTQS